MKTDNFKGSKTDKEKDKMDPKHGDASKAGVGGGYAENDQKVKK